MGLKPTSMFAWDVVGVSFITLAITYAVWYSFSVFFVSLLKEFRWTRSVASGAFSIFVIFHGISGPLAGSMVNSNGPRIVLLLGSLFLGGGFSSAALPRHGGKFIFISASSPLLGWEQQGGCLTQRLSRTCLMQKEDWPWESYPLEYGLEFWYACPFFNFLLSAWDGERPTRLWHSPFLLLFP